MTIHQQKQEKLNVMEVRRKRMKGKVQIWVTIYSLRRGPGG